MLKPSHILRKLNQMNFSVQLSGQVKCTPGWRKGKQEHLFHTMWIIAGGKGTFTIDGTQYSAEAGKLFVLTPGMITERVSDDEDPLEFCFIRFSFALAYEDKQTWTFAEYNERNHIEFPLRGMYTIQNPPTILNLCDQMNQLMKRRGQVVTMRQRILFLELLLQIVSDFRSQVVAGNTTLAIETTIEYMVNHYNEDISLADLANLAGLSTSHYSRLFKQYASYSPIDYLTHLRMDRAKELIILSDYKLKDIAESVGYHDELYFSRMFKKVVGIAPSTYAKKHKMAPH